MGVIGSVSAFTHLSMAEAFVLIFLQPAYIGPTQYSQMIWAVLLGCVLFGDGVDLPMVAGIVLIVASGLVTLVRENVRGTPLPPSVGGERLWPRLWFRKQGIRAVKGSPRKSRR